MKNNEDLNQVRIFNAVAQTLSFTKAAERLGMEKSSVSNKVRQLEQRLGVRLVQRTTRRVSLTEAGRVYWDYCVQALTTLQQADAYIDSLSREPSGLLRFSAPQGYLDLLLADVIEPFLAAYPKVRIELQQGNRRANLIDENFDLALRAGPASGLDSDLIAREVLSTPVCLAASCRYLRRRGTPSNLEELCSHDFISMAAEQPGVQRGIVSLWKNLPFEPNVRFSVNGMLSVRSALLQGLGFAMVPIYMISPEIQNGDVQLFEAFVPSRISQLHVVYPSRSGQPAKFKVFVEALLAWGNQLAVEVLSCQQPRK